MSTSLLTLTGRVAFVPNPCTTTPCLPGMAFALQTDTTLYYLTSDGNIYSDSLAWGDFAPQVGERVLITGRVTQRLDIKNECYLTVEVESARPA